MKINAELVIELRQDKSWSQEELALASGLNLRTVQRIEADATASLQSKKSLASAFDIDVRDLDHKEPKKMIRYEYKTLELPFKFGLFKQGLPDIDGALNEQAAEGWRLHQIVVPASSNMGQSERILAVMEREVGE